MSKLNVMQQLVEDLAEAFPKLTLGRDVYLVPAVMPLPSQSPLELQVCEGGSDYVDHAGEVRREQFTAIIGVLKRFRLDSGGRHARALSDVAESIYLDRDAVITALDGSFLTNDLLTRPLILVSESPVVATGEILVKTISFVAGLNVEMV